MKMYILASALALLTTTSHAGIVKPDCNASKAAKNAALEASVGISGRCDPEKTAQQAKEQVADNVNDKVDNVKSTTSKKVDNIKSDTADKVEGTKDKVSETKTNVSNKVSDVSNTASEIKEQPIKSMTQKEQ